MTKLHFNVRSKKFLIITLIIVLAAGGGVYAFVTRNNKSNNEANSDPKPTESAPYDLSPATEEEKAESEQHKDELIQQQNTPQPQPQPGQKKQVSVVITSADKNSINAYVSGVLEDGGTCTATLVKGGQTITRTSSAFSNVSTTNCSPITPAFPSGGSWTATVSYSSASAEGSAKTTVEVQ